MLRPKFPADTVTLRRPPNASDWAIRFGSMYCSMKRIWWLMARAVPCARQTSIMWSHCSSDTAIGFSHNTCLTPVSAAAQVNSACVGAVVAMIRQSGAVAASMVPRLPKCLSAGTPCSRSVCASMSAFRSQIPATSRPRLCAAWT